MNYPTELEAREAEAIAKRRQAARLQSPGTSRALPENAVGLALSGGGIRSATICLGVIQALAKAGRLRQIDFLSTISGGGYTGSFLGRLFTRDSVTNANDKCGRVQEILSNNQSPQIQWLRKYADYINNNGSDTIASISVFWRNLATIYVILAFAGLTVFAIARFFSDLGWNWLVHLGLPSGQTIGPLVISHWWPLPLAILLFAVLPSTFAFWLAPEAHSRAEFSILPTVIWIVLLTGFVVALGFTEAPVVCSAAAIILVMTPVWLEASRLNLPPPPDPSSLEPAAAPGVVIRNRLTRALGDNLLLFAFSVVWVLVDSLACTFATGSLVKVIVAWAAALTPVFLFLRNIASALSHRAGPEDKNASPNLLDSPAFKAAVIAFPLAAFLVIVLDGSVHWIFIHNAPLGLAVISISAIVSLCLGRAFQFLNYSSLQQTYASRLSRTFLGASNPNRLSPNPAASTCDVTVTEPADDLSFEQYHPEQFGCPLHLIGLCLNETVDAASQRDVPDSKSLSMCVGPAGVSVGRRFHALWCPPSTKPRFKDKLHALILPSVRPHDSETALLAISRADESFHVFRDKRHNGPIEPERLTIGRWTAISGAALSTGSGRTTSLPLALLLGLSNIRLGYWWNSGLSKGDRPDQFHENFWRRIKRFPHALFSMQSLLLSEFRARFGGPSYRRWNLSDGGFFDMTGMYELVRRRVPFIIAVDAGCDPSFKKQDLAEFVRLVRIDFRAEVEFQNPSLVGCVPNPQVATLPPWIAAFVKPEAFGKLSDIGINGTSHAALARVTYSDAPELVTWIVLIKSSLTGDEPSDVTAYAAAHPNFPNDPTSSQFFNESQWESYRMLGEHIGAKVFA